MNSTERAERVSTATLLHKLIEEIYKQFVRYFIEAKIVLNN